MKLGLIGLGNMGFALMENLIDSGHEVVGWNRSEEKRKLAKERGRGEIVETLDDLVAALPEKKVIISIISAGDPIDKLLFGEGDTGLASMLSSGDIVIEMANSHYSDSLRRSEKLAERGIKMLDVGISGGVDGARHGACTMVGGDKQAFEFCEEIFRDSTVEGGYGYFGGAGAGHFVKMVHNGIEYGMMQAISEGVSLIHHKPDYEVNMEKLLAVWNSGSIIESRLVGFLRRAYQEDPTLEKESAKIGSLGTGRWTVEEGLKLGLPLTAISHAVFTRYNSRYQDFIGWKAVSAMRRVFGAHSGADRFRD